MSNHCARRKTDPDYTTTEIAATVKQMIGRREGPVYALKLRNCVQYLATEADAMRLELKAMNEVVAENRYRAASDLERIEGKVDTLKDREELVAVTKRCDELWAERNRETLAKDSAIEQARMWKQEAKTQESIVRDTLEALGIEDVEPGFEIARIREAIAKAKEIRG